MITIPLQAVPNQSLSIRLDDALYDIAVKETNGCMSASIARDSVLLVQNLRCVAGTPLLALRYLEHGDFLFVAVSGDESLPYYDAFGTTQILVYASPAELEAFRNG